MSDTNYMNIELASNYKPKLSEPYMCPEQLAYFYRVLSAQKAELENTRSSVLNAVRLADKTESVGVGDESDNATYNQDITMDLRMSDRSNKLLQKINATGIGPGGLGGSTTAFAVNINTYPTHIAGLPVAVNICCHVNRHAVRVI